MPKLVFDVEELALVPGMGQASPQIDAAAEVDYDDDGSWALSDVGVVTSRIGKTTTVAWLDPVACRSLRTALFECFYALAPTIKQRVEEVSREDAAERRTERFGNGLRFARAI